MEHDDDLGDKVLMDALLAEIREKAKRARERAQELEEEAWELEEKKRAWEEAQIKHEGDEDGWE